jgi:hypothetical protein
MSAMKFSSHEASERGLAAAWYASEPNYPAAHFGTFTDDPWTLRLQIYLQRIRSWKSIKAI